MPGGVELAQAHETLLADIAATETPEGTGACWWMGQHTFVVKAGGKVIYIDPFFSSWESRQTPSPLTPAEGRDADYVLVTHGHGDHLDPGSLHPMISASPRALFLCPRTEAQRMRHEVGIPDERLHPLNAGEVY